MTTPDTHKASGYVVTTSAAGVGAALGYGLLSSGAGTINAKGYQIYVNPATAPKAIGYLHMWPGARAPTFRANGYLVYSPLFPPTVNFVVDFQFMEERFPDCISFSSSGGPGFKTNVVEFDSGIVGTDAEWDRLRANYSVNFEVATPAEIQLVESFFYIAKGRAIGFRFKDWSDYQIVQQNIGLGDGTTKDFPLFKRYQSGLQYYDRTITKPRKVSADGTDAILTVDDVIQTLGGDYYINESLGTISLEVTPTAGQIIRVVYMEYDVPVRFDTDELDITFDDFRQLSLEVPLIEILV